MLCYTVLFSPSFHSRTTVLQPSVGLQYVVPDTVFLFIVFSTGQRTTAGIKNQMVLPHLSLPCGRESLRINWLIFLNLFLN